MNFVDLFKYQDDTIRVVNSPALTGIEEENKGHAGQVLTIHEDIIPENIIRYTEQAMEISFFNFNYFLNFVIFI